MNASISAQQVDPQAYIPQLRAAVKAQTGKIGTDPLVADGRTGRLLVSQENRFMCQLTAADTSKNFSYGNNYTAGKVMGGKCWVTWGYSGGGLIESIVVVDFDKQSIPIDFLIFRALPTDTITDGVAPVFTGDLVHKILGVIKVAATDYVDVGNQTVATKLAVLPVVITDSEDKLYIVPIARAAATYTTGVRLDVLLRPA